MDHPLTMREAQVLEIASEGATNKAIGQRLGISKFTVSIYLHGAFIKLGVDNRIAAINAWRASPPRQVS